VPLPYTFLDSNVSQFLTTFGEYAFDGFLSLDRERSLDSRGPRLVADVLALRELAQLGTWYGWPIAINETVRMEHARDGNFERARLVVVPRHVVEA
jgi:hypothetical protein